MPETKQIPADELFKNCVYCQDCHKPIQKHVAKLLQEVNHTVGWYCHEHTAMMKGRRVA